LEGNVHEQKWNSIGAITLKAGHILGNIQPLFKKIDEDKIKEQVNKLNSR
jgi:methionyl-tRNA synthetase